jgi:hypothetical protein
LNSSISRYFRSCHASFCSANKAHRSGPERIALQSRRGDHECLSCWESCYGRPCTPGTTALARLTRRSARYATLPARHGVDRRIDGLIVDLERGFVGMHTTQYAGNLLRRMTRAQQLLNQGPERAKE